MHVGSHDGSIQPMIPKKKGKDKERHRVRDDKEEKERMQIIMFE